jgi:NhaA family Na+:H+ antiporter
VNGGREDGHVTTVVGRRPKPGKEREFEEFVYGIVDEASRFPGHRGARVFRPRGRDDEWRVMFTFESREDLERWEESEERRRWYERGRGLARDEPEASDVTGTAQEGPLGRALIPFDRFVRTSVSGTGLLLLGTALALLLANSPLSEAYSAFWETELTVGAGPFAVSETLLHWVNDALMALFFFLVGLEVKREVLVGELRSLRRAALPCVAALGGMLLPAAVYLSFNLGGEGAGGWGIPMATDIAFALGVLLLLGDRVPSSLRTFLVALAIADDVGAVLVIAVFYTEGIRWGALAVAAVLLLVLAVAARGGVNYPLFYAFLGVGVWLAVFESGVHATIAGVLVAMTVPARSWINASEFLARARRLLDDFDRSCDGAASVLGNARQQAAIEDLREMGARAETPMQNLQGRLNRWVAFVVLPLFALANAGLVLTGLQEALTSPVTLGVFFGLLVGKPLGITLFAWLAVRLGLSELPDGVGWRHVVGAGTLGGIGFTMSLFITGLAFGEGGAQADAARVGIFAASAIAGAAGWALLRFFASGGSMEDEG